MINILYAVWESIWRRMFGSDGWNVPIIKYRAIQHIFNVIATFGVLWYVGLSWWQNVAVCAFYEGFYWSWGHGPAFDIGRSSYPDEKTIKRYKERFWNNWCEKMFPESMWYGKTYDAFWMFFRYEIPAVLVFAFSLNYWFLLAGFATTFVYWLCWLMFDKGKITAPTDKAEWIVGFISGLLLIL